MTTTTAAPLRTATCSCGQLRIVCEGEPIRVSICHCYACQKRTGSVFGAQARWPNERVRSSGRATEWVRVGDEGSKITFRFCPDCGSTVYYDIDTVGGQSGSAVYRIVDGKQVGVAIHAYGGATHNSGTRISTPVHANLTAWIK